ncbi:hypothetical protein FLJC2902T_04880 [Flavobacterium limnosediminis JC2902]|uniref:Lipoprotein n=1 Tax=Flavobacterium limnosediminis JC2902 TaxID=1341181 RepID=V6STN3_9FLAO|nr:hypothetical protein [Flavobacterium limnosediminis]ESU30001.1 hypothetical protein FLJC2902T_04880 [Flavobacterium limnosediminis JC2902]
MKKFILSGLLTSVLFISCKDDKAASSESSVKDEEKPFTVTVNAVVKQDDIFQFFYNEDGSDSFAPENSITVNVKGNQNPQDIVFSFPKDAAPYALRFDLGGNEKQEDVKINKFEVNYLKKSIVVKDTLFRYYFYANEHIKYDVKTAIAKPSPTGDIPYDPIFMPTADLKKELTKIYQ